MRMYFERATAIAIGPTDREKAKKGIADASNNEDRGPRTEDRGRRREGGVDGGAVWGRPVS